MNEELISNNNFFSNKPGQFIAIVSPLLRPGKSSKKDFIYSEGDLSCAIYFLIKGECAFVKEVNGEWVQYAKVEQGLHFGELEVIYELIEDEPRQREETVRVTMDCEFFCLDKEDLDRCFS